MIKIYKFTFGRSKGILKRNGGKEINNLVVYKIYDNSLEYTTIVESVH